MTRFTQAFSVVTLFCFSGSEVHSHQHLGLPYTKRDPWLFSKNFCDTSRTVSDSTGAGTLCNVDLSRKHGVSGSNSHLLKIQSACASVYFHNWQQNYYLIWRCNCWEYGDRQASTMHFVYLGLVVALLQNGCIHATINRGNYSIFQFWRYKLQLKM